MDQSNKPLNGQSHQKNTADETQLRVLIIEDEDELREILINNFKMKGHLVEGLSSGTNAIKSIESFQPDVVLLDQIMPGKLGSEVIKEIRADQKLSGTPVMMVTGLNSEEEKVAALELGADDYVTKPFSSKELLARAQALVRRAKSSQKPLQKMLNFKDLNIDLVAHKVNKSELEIALTLTEYRILCELVRHAGEVLTRDKLREKALGNLNITDRTIDVHMASLRKKIGDLGDAIETVRGVGYRMA